MAQSQKRKKTQKTPPKRAKTSAAHQPFFQNGLKMPELEEQVLSFWESGNIFQKSLEKNKKGKEFVFFEGPPTANGHPGIHHVLSRSFKDIILRYKTMQGYFVPRRAGWDTHGLPVELQVEKALGLKSKKDIEAYGIEAFNQKCKESVWEYIDEWNQITRRMGFWLDEKNAYATYKTSYIETLWWIMSQIYAKGLLYEGYRIVPWCTRCGTGLSSHEIAQGYKEVEDTSVYVKFKLSPGQRIGAFETNATTSILSWTTTPWTLPGNVALAVGEHITYSLLKTEAGEVYVCAAELVEKVFGDTKLTEVARVSGHDLVGLRYVPLFDVAKLKTEKSYQVYAADFVTTTDGTGVVHTAVMYGEDDYKLGVQLGLPQHHTVADTGHFTTDVPELAGAYAKSSTTEQKIFEHLERSGRLFKTEKYTHEYPHCWRCDTPLLYYARSAWFVAMSKLKKQLVERNQTISWTPAHIKTGRFGEWLADVKDWNFSRERYWGTPIPLWRCAQCNHLESIESIAALREKVSRGNTFVAVRHTQGEHNVKQFIASGPETAGHTSHLTTKGKKDALVLAKKLAKQKFDVIYTSPYERTKFLAHAVGDILGCPVIEEEGLGELNTGIYNWKPVRQYRKLFTTPEEKLTLRPEGGESGNDVRARIVQTLKKIDSENEHKKILVVTHADLVWLGKAAFENKEGDALWNSFYPDLGGHAEIPVAQLPTNREGLIDLHRPFIDAVTYPCRECRGGVMTRIKELADVWFDAGSMPYAQVHFPFEKNQKLGKGKIAGVAFPADYIVEAMDQTRGWFYTLLAVATVLELPAPFKNVTCLGLINDKQGKKMSKSKGNIVFPMDMARTHGLDAVRWYFYVVNPPGETKNFSEAEISEDFRKLHLILYNCFVFWNTYADKKAKFSRASKNVLDAWIISRLELTIAQATKHIDAYRLREAGLAIQEFVDDLSRWYLRRSRRRLQKPDNAKEYAVASATLAYALKTVSQLLAPFCPFFAESLYTELARADKGSVYKESVHLDSYPRATQKPNAATFALMQAVRDVSSAGLSVRASQGIKVRQPLASVTVKNTQLKGKKEYLEIIKDEVNVKEVAFDAKQEGEAVLDTVITQELKEEGMLRELVRSIQELRQKQALQPKDKIVVMAVTTDSAAQAMLTAAAAFLKKEVNATKLTIVPTVKNGTELRIADGNVTVAIQKAK